MSLEDLTRLFCRSAQLFKDGPKETCNSYIMRTLSEHASRNRQEWLADLAGSAEREGLIGRCLQARTDVDQAATSNGASLARASAAKDAANAGMALVIRHKTARRLSSMRCVLTCKWTRQDDSSYMPTNATTTELGALPRIVLLFKKRFRAGTR